MDGDHTLTQCYAATEDVLHGLFKQLEQQNVSMESIILKTNMILPGVTCEPQASYRDISEATLKCLRQHVPAGVGGIAFLSGGQSPPLASARLNDIEIHYQQSFLPWPMSFLFARYSTTGVITLAWASQQYVCRSTCTFSSRTMRSSGTAR